MDQSASNIFALQTKKILGEQRGQDGCKLVLSLPQWAFVERVTESGLWQWTTTTAVFDRKGTPFVYLP